MQLSNVWIRHYCRVVLILPEAPATPLGSCGSDSTPELTQPVNNVLGLKRLQVVSASMQPS